MRKQDLQNDRLDQAGRRLIKAARISSDEIEKIVASPQLFNSVKARIKSQESTRRKKVSVFDWTGFGVWNWQKAGAAFAAAAFLFFVLLGLLVFRKEEPLTMAQTSPTKIQPPSTAINTSPLSQSSGSSSEKQPSDKAINEPQKFAQKAAFKPQVANLRKSTQKIKVIKQRQHPEEETEGEFIQLTFAGNLDQTSEDEQIIRVEIPRSSLVALGVSAPAENENEKVKTDLLIGSDGVVRAVRLIK